MREGRGNARSQVGGGRNVGSWELGNRSRHRYLRSWSRSRRQHRRKRRDTGESGRWRKGRDRRVGRYGYSLHRMLLRRFITVPLSGTDGWRDFIPKPGERCIRAIVHGNVPVWQGTQRLVYRGRWELRDRRQRRQRRRRSQAGRDAERGRSLGKQLFTALRDQRSLVVELKEPP